MDSIPTSTVSANLIQASLDSSLWTFQIAVFDALPPPRPVCGSGEGEDEDKGLGLASRQAAVLEVKRFLRD
jgi:hypothetical protein